jgi:hypothetical protein
MSTRISFIFILLFVSIIFCPITYAASTFPEDEVLGEEDEVDFSLDPPPTEVHNIHKDKVSRGYIGSYNNSHVTLEKIDFTIHGLGLTYHKIKGLSESFAFAGSIGGNIMSSPETKNRLFGFGLPLEGNVAFELWEQKHEKNIGHSIPIFAGMRANLYSVFLMVPRVVGEDSFRPRPPRTIGFKGNKISAQAGITPSVNLFDTITLIPYYVFEQVVFASIVPFRSERSSFIFNKEIRSHTFGLKFSFPSSDWARGLYIDGKYDTHDTPGEREGEIRTIAVSLGWFFGNEKPEEGDIESADETLH